MNKEIKKLIGQLKSVFSPEYLEEVARETNFKQRKGKLEPEQFLAMCVIYGEDLCEASLARLSSRLWLKENIDLSPQALDKRFNSNSISFLKKIFNDLLGMQTQLCKEHCSQLESLFKAIHIVDSSLILLPEHLAPYYKGTGGSSSAASVKLHLEYEFFSGSFLGCNLTQGCVSDMEYYSNASNPISGGLYLKDLGYFSAKEFAKIASNEGYYISKVKSKTTFYQKTEDPLYVKGEKIREARYKKVDLQEFVSLLEEGQTIEIPEIYISDIKLKTRLIITRLTKRCKESRMKKYRLTLRKRNLKPRPEDELWNCINIYITNIPEFMQDKEKIHHLYSLRWQVELMLKIWKSIYQIDHVHRVKVERFECFLYGRLISLFLSSRIVFTGKKLLTKNGFPISEITAFSLAKEFLDEFHFRKLYQPKNCEKKFAYLFDRMKKYAKKKEKKGSISSYSILKGLELNTEELIQLVG